MLSCTRSFECSRKHAEKRCRFTLGAEGPCDACTLENKRCSVPFQDKDGGVKMHIRFVELMGNVRSLYRVGTLALDNYM
jgi:hypothetical protein